MNYYKYHRNRNIRKRAKSFSIVTWLIAVNIVVFIIEMIALSRSPEAINFFALKASSILQGEYLWTLFLHMFVHDPTFPFLHLIVNMFVLFSLGGLSEKIIGRKRFFWFYIISGLFAGALSVLLAGLFGSTNPDAIGTRIFGDPTIFMVGASGAIFGIAGLYVTLLPRLKFMIIFLPFFSLPAYIMVPLVLFGMWIASIFAGWPIGNVAHFGGFISGFVYGLYLRNKYKRKVQRLQKMFR